MLISVAMGNLWGSKMAASSRVVQIVKPHQQLIKFPDRNISPLPNVHKALKLINHPILSNSIQGQQSTAPSSVSVPISQLSGPRDTVEIIRSLPQKYRRQPIPLDEMEYIQRGGPE
ncbi:28S ribosomal protein S36, mitochondrial isoform X2 [Scyliorhinus canicula]|uniref:28S ribosomal protein S36, mitochondrial isoform X2 n=1 Tax=Scyliorhinus canicula TaxID=7830 RepID=UPI0018F653E1|nr:28S ribosomal protein S36, mitochondrial isoform X2 [Scyliorhinus canicula]